MSTAVFGKTKLPIDSVLQITKNNPTPFYIYDERVIRERCRAFMNMPNAFGISPRYAMKANSTKAILQIITSEGVGIDASSLNEVRRAALAGIEYSKIMLTTQEAPVGSDLDDLFNMIKQGLRYNICSLEQLKNITSKDLKGVNRFSIRVHPGVGSGESASRNTGDKYSCFGVHLSDLPEALEKAKSAGVVFDQIHVHIGSGGDPAVWQENIDRELGFIEQYLPDVERVNFGGGFKEARMPSDIDADIIKLGNYAKTKVEEFYKKTGRKLLMEVEPGTYIVANSGYLLTRVSDIKQTGEDGFTFLLLNGGMEVNTRPLLYGSQHPFSIITKEGKLIYDEFNTEDRAECKEVIVVGRCCESGDSYTLDDHHQIVPRNLPIPAIGDYLVVGGAGAYCSSMSPFNYNSHQQIAEYLFREDNSVQTIRKHQSLQQIVENEIAL